MWCWPLPSCCAARVNKKAWKHVGLHWLFPKGQAGNTEKVEAVSHAQGDEGGEVGVKGGDGHLGCDTWETRAGLQVALAAEKDQDTASPPSPSVFPAEFGRERSVPLNNLSADEVAKALETIVKSMG